MKADPCARCGDAAVCSVWTVKLCRPCSEHWYREAPEPGSDFDDVCAAYREWTNRWISKGKVTT